MSYTEEEYTQFDFNMRERFPKMFSQPFGGFDIGKGWWPIIESLCLTIQSYIDWQNSSKPGTIEQVVVEQIKEKFGGLRFYYVGGNGTVDGMVQLAEAWASNTCESCGSPGETNGPGWVQTLCKQHTAIKQQQFNERFNK